MTDNKRVILISPLITEKTLGLYRSSKVCVFVVHPRSSKKQIEYEFESLYGIKPLYVRTSLLKYRSVKINYKSYKRNLVLKKLKKAYIGIGDAVLDIFESVK